MNILTLENITKVFTERKVFDETSFYMEEGEKVGVIGINGTGKSTLLKVIAGIEEVDEGKVIRAGGQVIRYLSQIPEFLPDKTVIESVLYDNREQTELWNKESDAKTMLTTLGITNFTQKMGELSGGQRKRIALVAALLAPADVLLLDEPTNHLDQEMADWLEEYLKNSKKSIVMVTHDRYFLDSVCNRIVELDKGKIYSYNENYSGFLQRKAEREEIERAGERKRQAILRTELAWVMRGARARTTKQKSRLQRYEELKNQKAPTVDSSVSMDSIETRLGKTTIELENLSKAYGDKILIKDFSYTFLKNDKIGFVGKNGAGKTTLLKMIMGDVEPDSGTITIGQTVKIGYFAQEIEREMDPNQRVIDYIKEEAEYVKTTDGQISATMLLEQFLFNSTMQYSSIGKLSGGERRRLYLCRVLIGSPNVLILDEPTNDLDISTLTVLEDYLDRFTGIVITVSHDRYFLDRVVRRIFSFDDNGLLKQYEGGYTEYMLRREIDAGLDGADSSKKDGKETVAKEKYDPSKMRQKKLKFTYMEEKEYQTIEQDIAKLEEKIEGLENDIIKYSRDFVKLNELTKEKERLSEELNTKMDRWMYLEDLAERIKNEK
ncbi:MAG: ABC-F family ATP-binding cassette domain-containing protein [Lachnospiraceae bacterium]|nr:ABC-F family ATP-binding cassette domain-containing protein [Lachnospiraceae bacterium]